MNAKSANIVLEAHRDPGRFKNCEQSEISSLLDDQRTLP